MRGTYLPRCESGRNSVGQRTGSGARRFWQCGRREICTLWCHPMRKRTFGNAFVRVAGAKKTDDYSLPIRKQHASNSFRPELVLKQCRRKLAGKHWKKQQRPLLRPRVTQWTWFAWVIAAPMTIVADLGHITCKQCCLAVDYCACQYHGSHRGRNTSKGMFQHASATSCGKRTTWKSSTI